MDKKVAISNDCAEPEGESREERFRRIARKRVTRTLKEFGLLGNLTGPNYKFSEEEVEAIFTALETALNTTRTSFEAKLAHATRDKANFDF